jgi:thymidine kinase
MRFGPEEHVMRGHTAMGCIEVICGPMFSGKSEELIRRLRRAQIARLRVQVFKPVIDDRYAADHIVSHSDARLSALCVASSAEVLQRVNDRTEIVGIDEAQFFDAGIVEVCDKLANLGKRVIVAGLDQDYLGRPFEPMPRLLAIAEYVTKALAICVRCGAPAGRSQRISTAGDLVVVGAKDVYEARCRRCFEPEAERQLPLDVSPAPDTGAHAGASEA